MRTTCVKTTCASTGGWRRQTQTQQSSRKFPLERHTERVPARARQRGALRWPHSSTLAFVSGLISVFVFVSRVIRMRKCNSYLYSCLQIRSLSVILAVRDTEEQFNEFGEPARCKTEQHQLTKQICLTCPLRSWSWTPGRSGRASPRF